MRRFLAPRWLWRHAAMLGLVAIFLSLGWWQIRRAQGGNALSFGYALEWPLFALFVVFVWYREIRSELRDGMAGRGASASPSGSVDTDPAGTEPAETTLLTSESAETTLLTSESAGTAMLVSESAGTAMLVSESAETVALISVPARPRRVVGVADPALDAYNHYLRWLNAHPDRRPGEYPGPEYPGPEYPGPESARAD